MLTSTITLTRRIYTPDAIQQTVEAFANICTASVTSREEAHILRVTAPRPQVMDEFLNYALALSAQELLR
jgi:hypothetical protein